MLYKIEHTHCKTSLKQGKMVKMTENLSLKGYYLPQIVKKETPLTKKFWSVVKQAASDHQFSLAQKDFSHLFF